MTTLNQFKPFEIACSSTFPSSPAFQATSPRDYAARPSESAVPCKIHSKNTCYHQSINQSILFL